MPSQGALFGNGRYYLWEGSLPKDIAKAAACLRFDEFCGMVFELCNTPAHQPSLTAWISLDITGYHWYHDSRFEVSEMWDSWTCEIGSREARGEAFYTALFDAAPSLQLMFKSQRLWRRLACRWNAIEQQNNGIRYDALQEYHMGN